MPSHKLKTRSAITASKSLEVNLEQVDRDDQLKGQACAFWYDEYTRWPSVFELVDHVAKAFGIQAALVNAWRTTGRWPVPNHDPSCKRFIGFIDEDDPSDYAEDPLHEFYNRHDELGNRRSALTYLQEGGHLRPSEINLDMVQGLLNRYPITLEDLSTYLCVETRFFAKYARANGVTEKFTNCPNQPFLSLLYLHDQLMQVVVTHAQALYRKRAVPIRFIACRLNLNWQELWTLGTTKGIWHLPDPETLRELDQYFSSRKT
jgi:hypothetical protein